MTHGTPTAERRFAVGGTVLYAIVTAVLCVRHEPWHDELQAWRIALDSASLRDLLVNLRYEGHPPLYHAMLWALGGLSRSWIVPVVLHWLVACGSAWVVLRWAPFSRVQRALIVSGYFVAYEYAVIVRPYGLGVFCALAACAAWCAPVRRTRTAGALLVLLANTSALGIILAVVIATAMLIDGISRADDAWWRAPAARRRTAVALATAMLMLFGLAWLILPPADALFKGIRGPLAERLWVMGKALSTPVRAVTPFASHFSDGVTAWSTWVFEPTSRVQVLLAIGAAMLVVLAGIVITSRRLAALVLWLSACAALVSFFGVIYLGGTRHHGYIVVALLAAAWLARAPQRGYREDWLERATARLEPSRERLFTGLLVLMVVPTVQAAVADFRGTFSDASEVASLVGHGALASLPVVGMSYPWSQPVAALLDRPIHLPAEGRNATFLARTHVVEEHALAVRTDSVVQSLFVTHCEVLLLTGKHDVTLIDLRSARALRAPRPMPMSDNPLQVWLLTAPRCQRGAR